tara:strand:+ start:228 stop:701 length:474 start_codon:yes stop_codon:yes gene_type:complete
MKVIADEDMYIASTWGAAIRLYKGEVKEVGDDFGLLALQQGARRVEDSPLRNPSLLAREEEVVEDAVVVEVDSEHNSEDGTDQEEIEVSGTLETEETDREEKLRAAMEQILDEGSPKDFTSEGLPKQSVIKTVFGEQISADERDEVWAEMIVDREED